ncbi:MAG: hypothetical protein JNM36_01050 [Chitinophagales bacterium]|mgnify:CR=1 FL=1|nr:hypothetical protein [Chitinophagales bacterium]
MRYLFWICIISCYSYCSIAQNVAVPDKLTADDIVYHREFTFGAKLHTRGWGVQADFVKIHSIFKKTLYSIEFMDYHSPKEMRQQSLFPNTRGLVKSFIYGKENAFFAINASMGKIRILAEKARRSGVGIGLYYGGGLSLGLQKPYYLNMVVGYNSVTNRPIIERERYTDENATWFLNPNMIDSGAGFQYGWNELQLFPGGQARVAVNFDWASYHEFVKAVEVGATFNAYLPEVGSLFKGEPTGFHLMVGEQPNYFFTTLYVRAMLGRRWR